MCITPCDSGKCVLLHTGRPMTQAELDGACEEHLRARLGERRDFAIENSLPTLLQDGLVSRNSQVGLSSTSLHGA